MPCYDFTVVDIPQTQANTPHARRRGNGKKDTANQTPPLSRKAERAKKRQAKKARQDLIQYLAATLS